jgi:uncharacterized protein (DUF1499 family)
MTTLAVIAALLLVAGTVFYLLLEKRPGYGAWYGVAKLTGARLDIGPVDWATLARHKTPNDALVCPPGHCPNAAPDFESAVYPVAPDELLARLKRVALAEPDTRALPADGAHAARFLQHTRLMRFPDTIDAQVLPLPEGQSTLALYSRSLVGRKDFGVNRARLRRWLAALQVLALCLVVVSPAFADRWFGAVLVGCDSFADCGVWPDLPEPPGDPAELILRRAGKASAPLEINVNVNKPVEGGVPIRLTLGDTVFALQPGSDVLTRRATFDGAERLTGYWIAPQRVEEIVAAMRRTANGRLELAVAGTPQQRAIRLDGMEAALRHLDERQGRVGAQDALIDQGPRAPADAAAPQPLPARNAWPKQIIRLFRRGDCAGARLPAFDDLTQGFIATVAEGRELWNIACGGGNYTVLFVVIEVRNRDPRTARLLSFPTRTSRRPAGVLVNPVWWDDRKEIWAFDRGRSFGDCGTVARYRWSERGLVLIDERRKEDCDDKFVDAWTQWPVVKPRRGQP